MPKSITEDLRPFRELRRIEATLERLTSLGLARVERLAEIGVANDRLPIYGLSIGPTDPMLPTFGLFAGVHGLEKVGTHLVNYYLDSLASQLTWDEDLRQRFEKVRLVAIPLVNPGGMFLCTRSNPRGVDLMRNAPIDATARVPFLLGGHRLTPRIPWYRGKKDDPMEPENEAVVAFVRREMFSSQCSMALDLHSGFGAQDRLWYPYAKSREVFAKIKYAKKIQALLEDAHAYHIYKVEPQSDSYCAHGDLWDYLYDMHEKEAPEKVFIPWTLEVGSWAWLRKSPLKLFSIIGHFNPVLTHRHRRVMRRHLFLFDFFLRITANCKSWMASS